MTTRDLNDIKEQWLAQTPTHRAIGKTHCHDCIPDVILTEYARVISTNGYEVIDTLFLVCDVCHMSYIVEDTAFVAVMGIGSDD